MSTTAGSPRPVCSPPRSRAPNRSPLRPRPSTPTSLPRLLQGRGPDRCPWPGVGESATAGCSPTRWGPPRRAGQLAPSRRWSRAVSPGRSVSRRGAAAARSPEPGGAPPLTSAPRLELAPEGVDAAVPVVRHLLEGLVRLLLHHLDAGARDQLSDGPAELRSAGRVAPAGEHERRRGDLRQPLGVVVEPRIYVSAK